MIISIFQQRIPKYRDFLFKSLEESLRVENITLTVYRYGNNHSPDLADESEESFIKQISSVPFLNKIGKFRILKIREIGRNSDLLVFEHALRCGNLYYHLLLHPNKVVLWGHAKAYTLEENWLRKLIMDWMAKRCSHFLAYTQGGAQYLLGIGVNKSNISVIVNSLETKELVAAPSDITVRKIQKELFREGGCPTYIVAYLGVLEEYKKLYFLQDSLRYLRHQGLDITCLIAGDGNLKQDLASRNHGEFVFLGYASPELKVAISNFARILLIPGRIGLVAIDSIFLGLPIVTTKYALHAPEFEYLEIEKDFIETEDNVIDFSSKIQELLTDKKRVSEMKENLIRKRMYYTGNKMQENFHNALMKSLRKISL